MNRIEAVAGRTKNFLCKNRGETGPALQAFVLGTVSPRRHPHLPFEKSRKMEGIFKPDLRRDFPHGERGRAQEKGRALSPQPREPTTGCHRLKRLELPMHPGRAAFARAGQVVYGNGTVKMGPRILLHPP